MMKYPDSIFLLEISVKFSPLKKDKFSGLEDILTIQNWNREETVI